MTAERENQVRVTLSLPRATLAALDRLAAALAASRSGTADAALRYILAHWILPARPEAGPYRP